MADLTVTAANVVKVSGSTREGVCGTVAITAGDSLYEAAGVLELCENDQTAVEANCVGIALNNASTGQPVVYQVSGVINLGATLAIGEIYCVGGLAGAIAPTADVIATEYQTVIGVAKTAANLQINFIASGVASA
jgi:hypothetical protein